PRSALPAGRQSAPLGLAAAGGESPRDHPAQTPRRGPSQGPPSPPPHTATCPGTAMSAPKPIFIVPYKTPPPAGHVLVGYHLQKHYGHEVVYTNAYWVRDKILDHAPDALVLDHLSWTFKVDEALFAKNHGMKLLVLPTEGLFQEPEAAVRRAGKL